MIVIFVFVPYKITRTRFYYKKEMKKTKIIIFVFASVIIFNYILATFLVEKMF